METGETPRPAGPPPTVCRRSGCRGARAVIIALVLLAAPAVAHAQGPFAPLPSQPTSTPTVSVPTTTTPATNAGGGLSSTEQIGLLAAALLLIGGIAYLIRRDAHANAPVGRPAGAGPRATTPPRAKRVERSRAKAKAARRQRKRARSR